MSRHTSPARRPSAIRQGISALLALVVFTLGLVAQVPLFHAWVHAGADSGCGLHASAAQRDTATCDDRSPQPDSPTAGEDTRSSIHDDSSCAVSLLVQSALACPPPLFVAQPQLGAGHYLTAARDLCLTTPQHLQPLGRAPPVRDTELA